MLFCMLIVITFVIFYFFVNIRWADRVEGARCSLSNVSNSSIVNGENGVRESFSFVSFSFVGSTVTRFLICRGLMIVGYQEVRIKKNKKKKD